MRVPGNLLSCCTLLLIGLMTVVSSSSAQDAPDAPLHGNPRDVAAADAALKGWWTAALETRDQRLAWWREARFGCFIHWGAYAVPAGEWNGRPTGSYSEHIMRQAKISLAVYKEMVVGAFDPEQFNADEWVRLIKGAGMKYVVITAKHHDGFAMWPSQVSKYNIHDATRFKRDPMRELSDACHRAGLRFGFYYSHAFDWEDPNAPGNDWDYENPGGDRGLFGGKDWYDQHPELLPRIRKYVDGKAIPQLRELIAMYHPDIFWFDTSGKLPFSEQLRIVQAVRAADPNVVINGRAARGVGRNFGDYQDTADNPAEVRETAGDWEAIPTMNNSYGYHKLDNNYKTPEFFIRLLAKTAAKGGNILLNIGPMANGEIDPHATAILTGIGRWMAVNGDSIHGTVRTPLDRQAWGDSTRKGNTLYLHVFDWPSDGHLVVGGLHNPVTHAYLLADPAHAPVRASRLNTHDLQVELPVRMPDATDSVVVLECQGDIQADQGRLLATNVPANRLLAFDGDAHARKVVYGDGKANRYYVAGLTQPTDYIAWNIRLNAPATFDVALKYSTNSAQQSDSYQVKIGTQTLNGKVEATRSATTLREVSLGRVTLPAGAGEVRLQPVQVQGGDLMNVFEMVLTPLNN